jgi:AraC-like DNA-binding protein
MLYRKYLPSPLLRSYVECFYLWECQQALDQPLLVESPPSGFASMVFNYGDAYRVDNHKHQGRHVPQAFLTGQSTKSYQLLMQGTIGMVGVVFKPAAISSLFQLPMYEFVDERTDLYDVLGEPVKYLPEQIHEARTPEQRIHRLEMFLLAHLSKLKSGYDRVDFAADLIVRKQGIINVGELMEEVFLGRRQFERNFLHKVGLSPKYYARIRRMGAVCATLANNRWQVKDWHDFIYRAGYYDQSHFIKEFTEFTGKSPSMYVKNNAELTHFLR